MKDDETLDTLRQNLMSELQPQVELETLLADLIISGSWQLRRAMKMETRCVQNAADSRIGHPIGLTPKALARLNVVSIAWEQRSLVILHDMAAGDALSNLERYRTAIEWHLFRCIHELRQLWQDRRGGKPRAS